MGTKDDVIKEFQSMHNGSALIYLDREREGFEDGYIRFNVDILRQMLPKTSLDFEIYEYDIIINCKSDALLFFRKLIFDCKTVGIISDDNEHLILKPYASVCDIMKVCCALIENFKK